MSSSMQTVDQVFQWLRKVFGVFLPGLPLPAAWRRYTGLFEIAVAVPLPEPDAPLPWSLPLAAPWQLPLSGVSVALHDIRIHVVQRPDAAADEAAPAAPSPLPPTDATKE